MPILGARLVYIRRMRRLAVLLPLIFCACPSKPTETTPDAPVALAPTKRIDPAHTSTIAGSVHFTGALPDPTMINAAGDGACVKMRPGTFDAGDVQVKDGKVANAFVWISSGLEDYAFDPPAGEVTVDQHGCMYQPRVLGVRTGQSILFVNSDETIHNIKSKPKNSKGWNFATPPNGRGTRSFNKQEVMVRLGCDVHPWMTAWVGVVDHPFFAITDAEGRFRFEGLPTGSYTVSAWHERLGTAETKITVAEAPSQVELTLSGPK